MTTPHKHYAVANHTFTPGPDMSAAIPAAPRSPGSMMPRQRLTAAIDQAAPWQQLTPDQQWFIDQVRGRGAGSYAAHPTRGANVPMFALDRNPQYDLVDMTMLHPCQSDNSADFYADLGGSAGTDIAARRPY